MTASIAFLRRHGRRLALTGLGLVLFALWFGIWLRVLPPTPRQVLHGDLDLAPAAISPDNQILATKHRVEYPVIGLSLFPYHTFVGPIQLWDISSGELLAEFGDEEMYFDPREDGISFSPDSSFLAAQHGDLTVWDVRSHQRQLHLTTPDRERLSFFHAFAADGKFLELKRDEAIIEKELHVIDLATNAMETSLPLKGAAWYFALSSDGKTLAYCDRKGVAMNLPPDCIHVMDLAKRESRFTVPAPLDACAQVAVSPDCSTLTAIGYSQVGPWASEARVWDVHTGQQLAVLPDVREIDYFPDSQRYLGECFDNHDDRHCVKVFDMLTGSELRAFSIQDFEAPRVVADGRAFIVSHSERLGKGLRIPDSLRAQQDDKETPCIGYYDMATGRRMVSIPYVDSYVLSRDRKCLAVRALDGTVQVWDLPVRRPIVPSLVFAAVPTLLFTALMWWWTRL